MGFIFNGLKATITITGAVQTGLKVPAAGQTIRTACGNSTIDGSYSTLVTPTGGKIFYVTDFYLGSASGTFTIADSGTAKLILSPDGVGPLFFSLQTPLPISTTLQVKWTSSSAMNWTFVGYEQ